MRTLTMTAVFAALFLGMAGCSKEKSGKDRSEAADMFERLCRLTEEYTEKLESAPDSADWAAIGAEFEEKLDKISFSYPPDTDLLLTEGQNDTIHTLMQAYVKARGERIHGLLHPRVESDSVAAADSLADEDSPAGSTSGSEDASHSHGN